MTVKTASADGFEVKRDELDWTAMSPEIKEEFEKLFVESDRITVDPRALERKFTIPERNRAMVREFRDCLEEGFEGGDGVPRKPAWGKTIVFAVTKSHAETLARSRPFSHPGEASWAGRGQVIRCFSGGRSGFEAWIGVRRGFFRRIGWPEGFFAGVGDKSVKPGRLNRAAEGGRVWGQAGFTFNLWRAITQRLCVTTADRT